ncbi:MAG: hypothetical protein ACRD4C_08775 [Candidatus Acidiferrales bacterium]
MDSYERLSGGPQASIWPGVIIVALIVVAGLAIVYAHSQRSKIDAVSARDTSLNASVAQLQNQLQSTTAKLNDMAAQQQAAAQAAAAEQAKKPFMALAEATKSTRNSLYSEPKSHANCYDSDSIEIASSWRHWSQ